MEACLREEAVELKQPRANDKAIKNLPDRFRTSRLVIPARPWHFWDGGVERLKAVGNERGSKRRTKPRVKPFRVGGEPQVGTEVFGVRGPGSQCRPPFARMRQRPQPFAGRV